MTATKVYQCQDCGNTDTNKDNFKLVKIKNIGLVHCLGCVKDLEARHDRAR